MFIIRTVIIAAAITLSLTGVAQAMEATIMARDTAFHAGETRFKVDVDVMGVLAPYSFSVGVYFNRSYATCGEVPDLDLPADDFKSGEIRRFLFSRSGVPLTQETHFVRADWECSSVTEPDYATGVITVIPPSRRCPG